MFFLTLQTLKHTHTHTQILQFVNVNAVLFCYWDYKSEKMLKGCSYFCPQQKKYLLHWKKASLTLPSASIRNSRTVGRFPKQKGLQSEVLSSLKRDYQCRHYKKCSLRGGFAAYLGHFSPARFFQLGAIQTRQQPRGRWAEGLKGGIYWQSSRPSERVLATRDQCHLKQKRRNIFIL